MPLGASRDLAVTKLLRTNGFFRDPRSYVSLPRKLDATVHLHLEGVDKSDQRNRIWVRFRGKCIICAHPLDQNAEKWTPNAGAWHHHETCDCLQHGDLRCDETTGRTCHAHSQPGFKRRVA